MFSDTLKKHRKWFVTRKCWEWGLVDPATGLPHNRRKGRSLRSYQRICGPPSRTPTCPQWRCSTSGQWADPHHRPQKTPSPRSNQRAESAPPGSTLNSRKHHQVTVRQRTVEGLQEAVVFRPADRTFVNRHGSSGVLNEERGRRRNREPELGTCRTYHWDKYWRSDLLRVSMSLQEC